MAPILDTGFPMAGRRSLFRHFPHFPRSDRPPVAPPARIYPLPSDSEKHHPNPARTSLARQKTRSRPKPNPSGSPPETLDPAAHAPPPFRAVPKDRYDYKKLWEQHMGRGDKSGITIRRKTENPPLKAKAGDPWRTFRNMHHLQLMYSTLTNFLNFATPFLK